jgi:hypothetical protein
MWTPFTLGNQAFGEAREVTSERKGDAGPSLFWFSTPIGATTTSETKNNKGMRMAQNRPGAVGAIAAIIRATTQRNAISLRRENIGICRV